MIPTKINAFKSTKKPIKCSSIIDHNFPTTPILMTRKRKEIPTAETLETFSVFGRTKGITAGGGGGGAVLCPLICSAGNTIRSEFPLNRCTGEAYDNDSDKKENPYFVLRCRNYNILFIRVNRNRDFFFHVTSNPLLLY